jgi:hypothetical protein
VATKIREDPPVTDGEPTAAQKKLDARHVQATRSAR